MSMSAARRSERDSSGRVEGRSSESSESSVEMVSERR